MLETSCNHSQFICLAVLFLTVISPSSAKALESKTDKNSVYALVFLEQLRHQPCPNVVDFFNNVGVGTCCSTVVSAEVVTSLYLVSCLPSLSLAWHVSSSSTMHLTGQAALVLHEVEFADRSYCFHHELARE